MIRSEEHFAGLTERFTVAALDGLWGEALDSLADACGATSGQLLGIGADWALPFNWMTRVDPSAISEFVEIGGGSPAINPRVTVGVGQPILGHWHEADCATDGELRRNFVYADYARRHRIANGSQTALVREGGTLIGLAVLRSDGRPAEADRSAFEALAPHVRSAALIQLALEHKGAALLAGALGSMGIAAFVYDGSGRVRALTPEAEACVSKGPLRLLRGRLDCADAAQTATLEAAVVGACRPSQDAAQRLTTVLLRDPAAQRVAVADVISLPRAPYAFGFEPRAVVALRGAGRVEADQVLGRLFGLTPAEADIAARLADGQVREEIAAARHVSLDTVNSQVKHLYAKLEISRIGELYARLAPLRSWRILP